jgi:hypothetical protein
MVIACASIFCIACNNATTPAPATAATPAADSSTEKIDYAYLPANHPPDYWDRGDQKKVAMVLKCVKAFENGNVDEAITPFADSIYVAMDGLDAKLSKDSLKSILKSGWAGMKSMKIVMDDYEAVISKDKKTEFVTLWYKQIITDKKGKTDSAVYVDDLKIENGKISVLDEKGRKFPTKK